MNDPIPADDVGQTLYAKKHGYICGKCGCYSQVWINQGTKKWTCHRYGCQGQGGLELAVTKPQPPEPLGWYHVRPAEKVFFGPAWCGPAKLPHGVEVLVARYMPELNSDGQTVEVYCVAMPARSYIIRALGGKDSAGDRVTPFELHTGAGFKSDRIAADIASEAARGMLTSKPRS